MNGQIASTSATVEIRYGKLMLSMVRSLGFLAKMGTDRQTPMEIGFYETGQLESMSTLEP